MTTQPQGAIPMIAYEDGTAAMTWLARATGFEERAGWQDSEGRLAHGAMETSSG